MIVLSRFRGKRITCFNDADLDLVLKSIEKITVRICVIRHMLGSNLPLRVKFW